MNEPELLALNQAARLHRALLTASAICGCFRCLSLFGHCEIRKWIQHDNTALCPRCGENAVIGDASRPGLTRKILEEMHKRWFER
ncbi:MAG TPA: cytoplasmic protein [Verrucomicrobiae bacterium]|nr:cytoplasmic protein [Verrucomicrobiae bacterium]